MAEKKPEAKEIYQVGERMDWPEARQDINKFYLRLLQRLDAMEGRSGTPTMRAPLNMTGNIIKGGPTATADITESTDYITKGYADENYASSAGGEDTTAALTLDDVNTAISRIPPFTVDDIPAGSLIASKLTKNAQDWITSIVFSASSNTVVAWTSGSIKFADGTTFSISSGNTGTMTGLFYIYFKPSSSTTTLQGTATFSTVSGEDVNLLCVAKNTADSSQNAFFVPAIGIFGINSTVIGPNSITTGSIQTGAITAAKIGAGEIKAASIDVVDLIGISLSGLLITGGTITGTTIKTATSGARVEMDSTNFLRMYDSSGTLKGQFNGTDLIVSFLKPLTPSTPLIMGSQASASASTALTAGTGLSAGTIATVDVVGSHGIDMIMGAVTIGSFIAGALDLGSGIALKFNTTTVIDSSRNIACNSLNAASIGGTGITASTGFFGPGGSITGLAASAITGSAGLSDSVLTSNVPLKNTANTFTVAQTLTSVNLNFSAGFGIAAGGTAVALAASQIEFYHSSTLVAQHSTSGTRLNIGGTMFTLSVVGGVVNAT